MTILKTEAIGYGVKKVEVATEVARGIDIKTGKRATIATEVKTMYSHDNRVFNLDGLKTLFETRSEVSRQISAINNLYTICNSADRAILLFSLNNDTEVLIRYKFENKLRVVQIRYSESGKITIENCWTETYNTPIIAKEMCKKHPDRYSGWRWLTINVKQSPNKRRLTIADALSRR